MIEDQARWGALREHLSRYGSDPERIGDFIWLVTGWPDAQERREVVEPYVLEGLRMAQQVHSVEIAARWLGRYDNILRRLDEVQGRARLNRLERCHVRYWLSGVVWAMVRREHMSQTRKEQPPSCQLRGLADGARGVHTWIILVPESLLDTADQIQLYREKKLKRYDQKLWEMFAARGHWAERWQGVWGEPFDRTLEEQPKVERTYYTPRLNTHEAPELPPRA